MTAGYNGRAYAAARMTAGYNGRACAAARMTADYNSPGMRYSLQTTSPAHRVPDVQAEDHFRPPPTWPAQLLAGTAGQLPGSWPAGWRAYGPVGLAGRTGTIARRGGGGGRCVADPTRRDRGRECRVMVAPHASVRGLSHVRHRTGLWPHAGRSRGGKSDTRRSHQH